MTQSQHVEHTVEVPVLIVGGGPTGLLTAYMLSKLGVQSLLIEKYPERLEAPKAHALCPRSLEICRQYDLDTKALRKLGSPREDAYWVNFVTNLSGERIGFLPYERMDKEVLEHTPEMIHNIPQPDFEAFVADILEDDPLVEMKKNVAFITCEQDNGTVKSTIEERSTRTQWQVTSRYVIACDGAKSLVRDTLGIGCDGEEGYETMMTIHFKADLRPVVGSRVGMLHWITDPACSGFIIAYDLAGNQVLISNFDSKKHPADSWSQELARDTVLAAIGQDIPLEILSYRPWILSRKVAQKYKSGNVFLVGDAAHSFPPTGGLGLNSGLADAHNVAYKIAAVLNKWADSSILESYQSERRHIALVNSAQSVKNGKRIFSFLKTLGTAGIEDVEEARANLKRSVHNPAKQEMIAREVESQREHFDNLEIHIGYVYSSSDIPANASSFTPKFVKGARLPHAWIKSRPGAAKIARPAVDVSYVKEFSVKDIEARQYSTLDLIELNSFTLIVPSRAKWLRCHEMLERAFNGSGVRVHLWSADQDFEFTMQAHRELFERDAGFSKGDALLIRPDQHIAAHFTPDPTFNDVLSAISGFINPLKMFNRYER
ncbi:uncharacterized protein E0L32_008779 [Thyridium curvatum]|uniref:FAD-binding domain-containing protein n=1 Tax=Thyridium curvatum TaxID=1093900 RepID=A0A507AV48_9PEZI|nr:uncharacterized protein E0L32_008779 [Thyridium curvatum]TPX10374.1 hypothetical protein E0L32_008779 [Thyridium curvatum]